MSISVILNSVRKVLLIIVRLEWLKFWLMMWWNVIGSISEVLEDIVRNSS